jgi:hypothetical protein
MENQMKDQTSYTGFVHAGGVCSWHGGVTPTEAAAKAVQQFKRDFKHIFKIKKDVEYKVCVFDTSGIDEWFLDDYGHLNTPDGNQIKEFEVIKVYA